MTLLLSLYTSIPGVAGLSGRRFPFVAETAAERAELEPSIAAICAWATGLIRSVCTARRVPRRLRDDLIQDVLVELLEDSIPRFDAGDERQAKLETFLFRCIINRTRNHIRKLKSDRLTRAVPLTGVDVSVNSTRADIDDRVQALAGRVVEHPEAFLTADDAALLRIFIANAGATQAEIARLVGEKHRQKISKRLGQIMRRTLAAVSAELAALH